MYFNASLLCEELKKHYTLNMLGPTIRYGHLSPPLLYFDGMSMQNDRIYIARGSSLPSDVFPPEKCCIVSIGTPPDHYLSGSTSCCVIEDDVSEGTVLNLIQHIFDFFYQWDTKLDALVSKNCTLQEFLEFCRPLFPGNFLLACDSSRRVLATTSDPNYVMDGTGHTPLSMFVRLKSSPEYEKMRNSREPYLYWEPYYQHYILTANIFVNDEFIGSLSLTGKDAPITDGRWFLFSHLVIKFTELFKRQFYMSDAPMLTPISLFTRLLDGEIIPAPQLREVLKSIGWRPDDKYTVGVIALHEAGEKIRSSFYLLQRLESMLSFALPFEYNGNIIVIMNLSKESSQTASSKQDYYTFLERSMLHAGVSTPFCDLLQLKNHCGQAMAALRLGEASAVEKHIYFFSDYALQYLLSNMRGEIEPDSLCPAGLLKLRELDSAKRCSYMVTLDAYFRTGFNATQAAKELYVNRSTFLARMERIKNILQLDLEDYDTRLYIMLCMELIDF